MRVLVTGATGFIGRLVARELVAAGVQVRALVREPRGAERLAEALDGADAEHAPGDMTDLESVARAVRGCESVVHFAARVDPATWTDAAAVDRDNRWAAIEIARLAREAGCRRFVFASSIAAMGFRDGLAKPDGACEPLGPYGEAKLAVERALMPWSTPDFEVSVQRLPTVYGPGERFNFFTLVRVIDQGLFRVIGSGKNTLPLCTAKNGARIAREAALGRAPPGIHLISDDARYSMLRVQKAICDALGRRVPRLRIPTSLARVAAVANEAAGLLGAPLILHRARVRTLTVDQPFDLSSLGPARAVLDAPLEEAVAATVAHYRQTGLLRERSRERM